MVRVKFTDIHQLLLEAFPDDTCSSVEVSRLVRSAFPAAQVKRETKGKKETFYIGMERCCAGPSSECSLEASLRNERMMNEMLTSKVHQLEEEIQSIRQNSVPISTYQLEFSSVLSESSTLCLGPNSLEHLDNFSLSEIASDLQLKAPNLFSLFRDLGDTNRNARPDTSTTTEGIKALASLCTLANARTQRAKGVQLFLSIMLIARAVNKQVISNLNCIVGYAIYLSGPMRTQPCWILPVL